MFINWVHFCVPKISFLLAFLLNPLFVHLIRHENNVQLGSYRYLLFFFAFFNMLTALVDILIPVCVHAYRSAFMTFLVGGPFFDSSFGAAALSLRCGFIGGTYGILNVHFIFRYLLLRRSRLISQYFLPYGFISSVYFVSLHVIIWTLITYFVIHSSPELRQYIQESFKEEFAEDINHIYFCGGIFAETSDFVIYRSWAGIGLLTLLGSYSITLYFVLGYKILSGLNRGLTTMSHKTTQMQKQLFKALTVQTIIPVCVSFAPCTFAFYGAALRLELVSWVYWAASIAVSMFPFLDPLAIILCLPALRCRLRFAAHRATVSAVSN